MERSQILFFIFGLGVLLFITKIHAQDVEGGAGNFIISDNLEIVDDSYVNSEINAEKN